MVEGLGGPFSLSFHLLNMLNRYRYSPPMCEAVHVALPEQAIGLTDRFRSGRIPMLTEK